MKNPVSFGMMESKAMKFITHQSIFSMVRSGDLDGLKQLLEQLNKDLSDVMSLQNDAGETPLYIAAGHNLVQVFSFLLKFCDFEVIKIRSKSDMNPFHVAAKRGHLGEGSFL